MKEILTIAKKELRGCFSDKAILAQILLLPFVIVFGYALLMTTMGSTPETETTEITAYYMNAPADMEPVLKEIGLKASENADTERYLQQITAKECDLLVVFPEDFAIAELGTEMLSDIQIYHNSSNMDSLMVYNQVTEVLDLFQPSVFTINAAPDVTFDLGDENYMNKKMLGFILPMMILMSVFMVCMNLAAESIAGDKERGFLNTLLITPVKRSHIAAGKSLCIFVTAVIGGLSAFAGMAVSLPRLADALDMGEISYSLPDYLLLFILTISAVFALAGLLLIVSTLAKDVKQATNIAPIILLILMVAAMLTTVDSFSQTIEELGMINTLIPAWNSMLLMQEVILMDYEMESVLLSSAVNLIFTVIAVGVTGCFFEHEKILNG